MAYASANDPGFLDWWNDQARAGTLESLGYQITPQLDGNLEGTGKYETHGQYGDQFWRSPSGAVPGADGRPPADAIGFDPHPQFAASGQGGIPGMLGSVAGFALGGPAGAAIGGGLGNYAETGDLKNSAINAGISYGIGTGINSLTSGSITDPNASAGASAPGENFGTQAGLDDSVTSLSGERYMPPAIEPNAPSYTGTGGSMPPAGTTGFAPGTQAGLDSSVSSLEPSAYGDKPVTGGTGTGGYTDVNLDAPTGPAQVDVTTGQGAETGGGDAGGGDVAGTTSGGQLGQGLTLGGGGVSFPSSGGGSGGGSFSGAGGGGSLGGGDTIGGQGYDGSMSGGDNSDYGTDFSDKTSELSQYWDKVAGGLGAAGSALAKYGPLALGVAGFQQSKKAGQAAATNLKTIGTTQSDLGKSLVDGYQNGTLNPADTAAIDRWAAQQIAAIKQHMANAGTSDSTQSLALQREIAARAEEMKAVSRENLLKVGLTALNQTDQYQVAAINAELAADQNAINFASRFMGTYAQWLYAGSRMIAPDTQSKVGV